MQYLPTELHSEILSYLDPHHQRVLGLTHRNIYELTRENSIAYDKFLERVCQVSTNRSLESMTIVSHNTSSIGFTQLEADPCGELQTLLDLFHDRYSFEIQLEQEIKGCFTEPQTILDVVYFPVSITGLLKDPGSLGPDSWSITYHLRDRILDICFQDPVSIMSIEDQSLSHFLTHIDLESATTQLESNRTRVQLGHLKPYLEKCAPKRLQHYSVRLAGTIWNNQIPILDEILEEGNLELYQWMMNHIQLY